MTRNVYIVEDDAAVSASLQSFITLCMPHSTVQSFRMAETFMDQIGKLGPGVLLLDQQMPGRSGFDVLRSFDTKALGFAPIMLTGHGDVTLAVDAMKAGAVDFLEKPYTPQRLMASVEAAFDSLEKHTLAHGEMKRARKRIDRLSQRERDVLAGLIAGRSNKGIARDLDLSPRTVEIHRARMMDKLEVASLSEALHLAFVARST